MWYAVPRQRSLCAWVPFTWLGYHFPKIMPDHHSRAEWTEPTALAEPGGSGESQGQSRPAHCPPPEEAKESLEQNQQELVCSEGGRGRGVRPALRIWRRNVILLHIKGPLGRCSLVAKCLMFNNSAGKRRENRLAGVDGGRAFKWQGGGLLASGMTSEVWHCGRGAEEA